MKKNSNYDALKLNNQVCFPLYACSKELTKQYSVMMVMWEKETVSSRQLADSLHLDYGTLTPVLKRLETAGYITRRRDPQDERLLLLNLTKKGEDLKDEAIKIPSCIAKNMGLTEEEFKTLYMLTYKALSNMESNDSI